MLDGMFLLDQMSSKTFTYLVFLTCPFLMCFSYDMRLLKCSMTFSKSLAAMEM